MQTEANLRSMREALLREVLDEGFGGVSGEAWAHLLASIEWKEVSAGDVLFRQGDTGDAMYIVLSGRLRAVQSDDEEHDVVLGDIGRGETVGEMALLTGEPRTAAVSALRDSVLARLDNEAFKSFTRLCPEALAHIARVQIGRLQRASHPRRQRRLSLVLVGVTPGTDLPGIARSLHQEIARRGPCTLAAPDDLRGVTAEGRSDAEQRHHIALHLNELEASTNYLLMVTDGGDSAWNRQCLRHADIVLLAARPGEPVTVPTGIPDPARRIVVALHPAGASAPRGTAALREKCSAREHFHLREKSAEDLRRLGRFLTGRAVGIAFAGGGARSFCHLGVMQALQEHGIPMDLTAGTSLGAIVASGIALDLDQAEILRRFQVMVADRPTSNDYVLVPRNSLLSGRKLNRLLPRLLPDTDIEDCWKTFACVSANITNPGAHIHRTGSLIKALRSTVSIPGVFPPVMLDNGDLLVDGGVVNNLPADVLRLCGAGEIIACDQGGPVAKAGGTDKPNAIGIIMRSVILHSRISGRAWRTAADIYFESPVGDISLLEWDKFQLAVSRGYENAKRVLENVDPAHFQ